jgi:hypothetical protein
MLAQDARKQRCRNRAVFWKNSKAAPPDEVLQPLHVHYNVFSRITAFSA